jgi:hypothetical protein
MQRIFSSIKHAIFLLRKLGLRRFGIVLVFWILRRYRRLFGLEFREIRGAGAKLEEVSRDPVLVYQMSKVGSTSLLYSLQFAYLKAGLPNVPLHHAHTLTNLDLHEQLVKDANGPGHQLALVHEYKKIRKTFEQRPDDRWNVISLVRDPVARQVSDYFHHIDRQLPNWQARWSEGDLKIDEVLESFVQMSDPTQHWFEGEIQGVLGIDVYGSEFPHEAGYRIYYREPKVSLMVVRLEDMNRISPVAIEKFIGLKGFRPYTFNMGSESGYAEIYNQFKAKPLPPEYLEKAYASRMACHFYTKAELERFTAKWSGSGSRG